MAIAFAELGFEVAAIYPRGNPLSKTSILARSYAYKSTYTLWALTSAIETFSPDLIVPGDDRVVRHLHSLYAAALRLNDTSIISLIERSIGNPSSYEITDSRIKLLTLASEEGLLIPNSCAIAEAEDLREWGRSRGFPWVLKRDASCAGEGVAMVVGLNEALRKFQELSRPPSIRSLLKKLLVHSEPFPIAEYLSRRAAAVSVQQFIHGRSANITVACLKGEVLAATTAVALAVIGHHGAMTIARIIENEQMLAAAKRLVDRLGLSGFVGFDFIIEEHTGDSYLIEMNPRFTQLTPVRMGVGHDLVGALSESCFDRSMPNAPPITTEDKIAFFPQAWLCEPTNPLIRTSYHDVPWDYPELMRELITAPRSQRWLWKLYQGWSTSLFQAKQQWSRMSS